MAEVFNWIRPGYELVTVRLQWNVKVPFLKTIIINREVRALSSELFSPQETPNSKWDLMMYDEVRQIGISVFHYDSAGNTVEFVEPVLVKMSILDRNGQKVIQKMLPSKASSCDVDFRLSKEEIFQSDCQKSDKSYTFHFKILTHKKKDFVSSSADPSVLAIDCSGGLSNHLEGVFNNMQTSDVNFNIDGRDFPAHKNILAARSEVFAAMFKHPTKENLTNQIKIEDIEPDVFHEMLRFIYTGRVPLKMLETMAASLFIAADKYLLDELKIECENYFTHQMSPENCVVLLLTGSQSIQRSH